MSDAEAKKVTDGSIVYGATTGALDATVFKYVSGMKGPLQTVLNRLKLGKAVPEGTLKKLLVLLPRMLLRVVQRRAYRNHWAMVQFWIY